MKIKILLFFIVIYTCAQRLAAQDISLYQQFNGRYDFVFVGNTLNVAENGAFDPCLINTESSATLSLAPNDEIQNAFLYWAGSGPGEFDVTLNGQDITAQRTFGLTWVNNGLPFFSAFADVTAQVQATGNGTYTLSDLDIAPFLILGSNYCSNGTNFGGWAMVIIYKNDALPLNQLNLYDGLQNVPEQINITLNNLNVIDNADAKIGFVAWEGDRALAVNETLTINGNPIGNPPFNPVNNAFNGTNSFTGAENMYNMDLDVYNIQNNIQIGDTTAEIQLTSGQDFVMINAIVTKLNSQLPDATIVVDNVAVECNSNTIVADYIVYNINSTNELPAMTPISIYANGMLLTTIQTPDIIPIGGNITGQITLVIPAGTLSPFALTFNVDDIGNNMGIVTELLENNNSFTTTITLLISPAFNVPLDLLSCNLGFGVALFDFSGYAETIAVDSAQIITFHITQLDAENGTNEIVNTGNYTAPSTPMVIFVRVDDGFCYSITSFLLKVRNCPPIIYNYVSANNDGINDTFFVDGLHNIFLNFEMSVYSRWGRLLWRGNNNTIDWTGSTTEAPVVYGNQVPDGTYYYVLELNDPDYPAALTGFLYFVRGD